MKSPFCEDEQLGGNALLEAGEGTLAGELVEGAQAQVGGGERHHDLADSPEL